MRSDSMSSKALTLAGLALALTTVVCAQSAPATPAQSSPDQTGTPATTQPSQQPTAGTAQTPPAAQPAPVNLDQEHTPNRPTPKLKAPLSENRASQPAKQAAVQNSTASSPSCKPQPAYTPPT